MPSNNKTFDNIKRLALENVEREVTTVGEALEFLKKWWCRYYKRPYKDPLLQEYTIEELLLEFYENSFLDNEKMKDKFKTELILAQESEEDHEEWLKSQMGDAYQTEEEMAEAMALLEQKNKG